LTQDKGDQGEEGGGGLADSFLLSIGRNLRVEAAWLDMVKKNAPTLNSRNVGVFILATPPRVSRKKFGQDGIADGDRCPTHPVPFWW
jgi:hypothetical protein